MHENQITLSERTVRALVTEQFPQWAAEPLRRVDSSGTVNTIVRIGEHHAARFPLLGTDPEATLSVLEAEARAAEEFAGHCPFPAPLPVGIGAPGHGYPLPWSVQTWLPGTVATDDDPARSDDVARDLAALITALRGVDTHGRTFGGANRGGELGDHDKSVRTHLSRSGHLLDVGRLTALWRHFRELPPTGPDVMTHGDLIPPNLLVTQRRLVGVLDCGRLRGGRSRAGPDRRLVRARRPARAASSARSCAATISSGNAGSRGRSSRRWASSSTTQ